MGTIYLISMYDIFDFACQGNIKFNSSWLFCVSPLGFQLEQMATSTHSNPRIQDVFSNSPFSPMYPQVPFSNLGCGTYPKLSNQRSYFKHKDPNKKVGGLCTVFVGGRVEPRNTFECSPHPATLTIKWLSFLVRSPWVPSQSYSCILCYACQEN